LDQILTVWTKFPGDGAKKFIFAGLLPQGAPNLVQKIVLKTSSYIVCFNFYVQQFKVFFLGGGVHHLEDFGGFVPLEDPQIWSPEIHLNLVQIIVSQTACYIMSFKLLC